MSEFRILFKWVQVKADVGEFRQDSDLLEVLQDVPVLIAVRVPFEKAYWDNYEDIVQMQLAGPHVDPILTPAGMAYAKRKLEEPFKPQPIQIDEKEEWGKVVEQEKATNPSAPVASDNEEWITTSVVSNVEVSTATMQPEVEDWGTSEPLSKDEGNAPWDEKTSPFEED